MISVVIPLYDKAAHIADTLESVRVQYFSDYELLIVDDGSTDGSQTIVRKYLKRHPEFGKRVRFFEQVNAGVSAARNKGIRESRYDWIAFLDADDRWSPEYLETQMALSEKFPSCEVLACQYGFNRGIGKNIPGKFSGFSFDGPDGMLDNYFEVACRSHPPLSSISTIVRRHAIDSIGNFPQGIASGEDLLTWARLAVDYRIAFSRRSMATFYQDPIQFNSDQRARMPARKDLVGECLDALQKRHPDIPGLKKYVGVWHKMRTRIFLSNAMKKEAWREWWKLLRSDPVHFKTWAYLLPLASPIKLLS